MATCQEQHLHRQGYSRAPVLFSSQKMCPESLYHSMHLYANIMFVVSYPISGSWVLTHSQSNVVQIHWPPFQCLAMAYTSGQITFIILYIYTCFTPEINSNKSTTGWFHWGRGEVPSSNHIFQGTCGPFKICNLKIACLSSCFNVVSNYHIG